MQLHFKVGSITEHLWPGVSTIQYNGEELDLVYEGTDTVAVTMSENLTIGQHKAALEQSLPGAGVQLLEAAPKKKVQLQELNLDSVDLVNFKAKGVPVWASVFKKAAPVFDRGNWGLSEESDEYIYIPNCTKYGGEEAEDFNSNAMYTQVMLTAYKLMCEKRKIDPLVRLLSGVELNVSQLETRHGVRNSHPGERAAGLANSYLVDFDDSKYGKDFLEAVAAIPAHRISREPARRTVLSKSEYILAGKMSHTYNQRFVKTFLELLSTEHAAEFNNMFKDKAGEAQANVVGIFRAMVMDGFVLDEGKDTFEARLWAASMGDSAPFFMGVYSEAS